MDFFFYHDPESMDFQFGRHAYNELRLQSSALYSMCNVQVGCSANKLQLTGL
jgi:hypothetical protein